MNFLKYPPQTLWNNTDEVSQVSSSTVLDPADRTFQTSRQKVLLELITGTLYWNLFLFMDWLSKSEVQLDTILFLVSGHMDTYCVCLL